MSRMHIEGYTNLSEKLYIKKNIVYRAIQKYRKGMRKPFLADHIIKVHIH